MIHKERYYRNAESGETSEPATNEEGIEDSGWYQITDSVLNFADRGSDIWNKIKYGENYVPPGSPGYPPPNQAGMSTGAILAIVAVGGLVVYGIYKLL